ncbi:MULTISPECIES: hypothetical protein [Arsenophonus]|uniref:hypothetical protein n=1 Tax=Arsenophonus TaxID=637 RepID=UPI0015D89CFD|nr:MULTISPECIES: hypothetical protein [Arsenophonus]UBX30108.1 hypothetical protein LDL57_05725 [Arsenophonus apicola]
MHKFAQVFAHLKSPKRAVLAYAKWRCPTAQKTTCFAGRRGGATTAIFHVFLI